MPFFIHTPMSKEEKQMIINSKDDVRALLLKVRSTREPVIVKAEERDIQRCCFDLMDEDKTIIVRRWFEHPKTVLEVKCEGCDNWTNVDRFWDIAESANGHVNCAHCDEGDVWSGSGFIHFNVEEDFKTKKLRERRIYQPTSTLLLCKKGTPYKHCYHSQRGSWQKHRRKKRQPEKSNGVEIV
jgi:hypothetical protein